ncbi:MAG: hypothetical protein H6R14_1677 [Proteobacteria bacterium]|nr:hypothetical protein [Pseudomonadota bacterium]
MVIVSDQSQLHGISNPGIHHLVAIRLQQLIGDASISTELIIVETGDAASAIEHSAGFPILTSLFDDLPYDHPDYTPPFEIMEQHHYEQYRIYEMVFIGNDDGAATALFVPDQEGIDADLLAVCRSWATPAVSTP